MTSLEIRPLERAGAEVVGADLARINLGEWTQVEAAFAAFGLLVFRDQLVSEAEFIAFARRWGSIQSADRSAAHPDHCEIEIVDADSRTWRSDGSFLAEPPLGAVLTMPGAPAPGTVTRVCNLASAYDELGSSTQRELEGLTATHAGPGATSARHPVVIRHPLSGRKVMYVNPAFTTGIDGIQELDGLAILNQLHEHCQEPEFIGEFEWLRGTVALIDHRAMLQFDAPARVDMVINRVRINGCALTAAARVDESEPNLVQRAGATLAGGVLTAAMTGIAEVIEPEKVRQEIEIVSEAPEDEPLTELDFGHLPPID